MVLVSAAELDAWIKNVRARPPRENKFFFAPASLLGALLELKALRAEITKNVAILKLAKDIGEHWRNQEGVNGALLDELAQLADATEETLNG